jgi:hypothetical protein
MNGCHMDDYIVNPDNWNFTQQIDYQSEYVELSNVHENIPLVNDINSNIVNHSSSTMIYDLPLPQQHSPSNLRLKK